LTTPHLTALLLSDGKPGHYHQAEGVIAAIARVRPVETVRCDVRRRFLVPTRSLHQLVNRATPPAAILWLGYGMRASALPAAHVVVSAGGETLAANTAAAKLLGAANVFCGRLRKLAPEHFRLVIVNMETPGSPPNQLVSLPPSPIDVRRAAAADRKVRFGRSNPPRHVGMLVGGNSGAFRYGTADWTRLTSFLYDAHRSHGISWMATTSRRSGHSIADALAAMAAEPKSGLVKFIDFRAAGPGTVSEIFAQAEAILCTDDSTTMISEAVGACLPVVAVRPEACSLEAREAEYREFLARKGWYRPLPLTGLTAETFLKSLEEISPRTTSQIDELAAALRQRLPELFAGA
jgi:uncharacterized protein